MDEVHTARLTWRPVTPAETDAIHALASDYEVVKMTGKWPYPAERAATESRCQPMDPARGFTGPVLRNGEVIGMMGLHDGAMGYMFARAHWGRGYATEMGRALIDLAFARYDWPGVKASVWLDNPGSSRVLDKLGFEPGATRISHCVARAADLPIRDYWLPRP